MSNGDRRYGPHNRLVEQFLTWIESGELLRFGRDPSTKYTPVPDLAEALTLAQSTVDGMVDWSELRENAEAAIYEPDLFDAPDLLPYQDAIDELVPIIGDKVQSVLPTEYLEIIDDVIADLNAIATCLAIHGTLDKFHEYLWEGYNVGGWPCGCSGEKSSDPNTLLGDDKRIYLFWREKHKAP